MKCTYILTSNNLTKAFDSYWELRDYIENSNLYNTNSSGLASASTPNLKDIHLAIVALNNNFTLNEDEGELIVTDKDRTDHMDILHYIDSDYFDPDLKYYLKKDNDKYVEACKALGMSDADIQNLLSHHELIGADAYVIHDIANNLALSKDDDESWAYAARTFINLRINEINSATGRWASMGEFGFKVRDSYMRIKPYATLLALSIKAMRKTMFMQNKVDKVTSEIAKNIGLVQKLNNGITLLGHIDSIIIDKDGNLSLYLYKVSGDLPEVWSKTKRKKFNLELTFLKHMLKYELAKGGINVGNIKLYIVPIFTKYNADNILGITIPQEPIDITVQSGRYLLDSEDEVVDLEIPIDNIYIPDISSLAEKGLQATNIMFDNVEIRKNKVRTSVQSFIRDQYDANDSNTKRIRKCPPESPHAYEVHLKGKSVKYIDEKTSPLSHNSELEEYLTKHFDNESENVDEVIDTLIKDIRVARQTHLLNFSSFANASSTITQALSKYIMPKGGLDSQNYEWEIIDNPELRRFHILLFRNKNTHLLDVITLSATNIEAINRQNGNENILNSYLLDSESGNLFNYKGSYGHIDLISALNILNEVLPSLGFSFKLGDIKTISTYGEGLSIYYTISDLVSHYYNSIVDTINLHNPDLNLVNNYSNFLYMDLYELVSNYANDLLTETTYGESSAIKLNTKELLQHLMDATSEAQKRTALKGLLDYLQNNYLIRNLIKSNNFSNIDYNSRLLLLLYNLACYAYNSMNGLYVETKYKPLTDLESHYMIPTDMSDNNYKAIVNIVTRTTNLANELILKKCTPIKKFVLLYLKSCGYDVLSGAVIGNENQYFMPLLELDKFGNFTMMFKNPFKDTTLNSHLKLFLKLALFEFAKVTYGMLNKDFNFSSYEDVKFKELLDNNLLYLQVPLMRGASNISKRSLRSGWEQFIDTIKHPIDSFNKYQLDIDKSKRSNSLRFLMSEGVKNPFSASMSTDDSIRLEMLDSHDSSFWEINIPGLLYNYVALEERTKEFNNSLVLIKSIMHQARILGVEANNTKYLEWFEKEVGKYLKVNVFRESILDDASKGVFAYINPLKHFVSKVFLSFNVKSAIRDTLEGFLLNFVKAANKWDPDLKTSYLTKAYKYVTTHSFTNVRSITLMNLLCIQYGLSNLDFANIATGLRTDRSGITHLSDMAFLTMKRPDYLNRMTLFVARCMQDGVWDALSLDENGYIKYDWKKDSRYKDYVKSKEGTKEYNEARARYFEAIRTYNKEHLNDPIEYSDDLPMPYSLSEIDNIKEVANKIYGNYDRSGKVMAENMAKGMAFGQFTTFMNGLVSNWFSQKRVILSNKEKQLVIDGKPVYLTANGERTFEAEGNTPCMAKIPIVVQGILGTYGDLFRMLLKDKSMNKVLKYLQANPLEAKNVSKSIIDLLYFFLVGMLFKCIFDPAYNELLTSLKSENALASALAASIYKGGSLSYANFAGPGVVATLLGENMNPPFYQYPLKELKSAYTTFINPKFLDNPVKQTTLFTLSSIPAISAFKDYAREAFKQ